jgi:hypothetical protein
MELMPQTSSMTAGHRGVTSKQHWQHSIVHHRYRGMEVWFKLTHMEVAGVDSQAPERRVELCIMVRSLGCAGCGAGQAGRLAMQLVCKKGMVCTACLRLHRPSVAALLSPTSQASLHVTGCRAGVLRSQRMADMTCPRTHRSLKRHSCTIFLEHMLVLLQQELILAFPGEHRSVQ